MKKEISPAQVWTTEGRGVKQMPKPVYKNTYVTHKFNSTDDKRESHLLHPTTGQGWR